MVLPGVDADENNKISNNTKDNIAVMLPYGFIDMIIRKSLLLYRFVCSDVLDFYHRLMLNLTPFHRPIFDRCQAGSIELKTCIINNDRTKISRRSLGFTLIELILVIVILGILSVVAVPKFVDLSSQAEISSADAVLAAAESAAAINFAANRAGVNQTVITSGSSLLAAFDGNPVGWAATAANDGITHTGKDGTAYTIKIDSNETTAVKAALSPTW